MTRLNLKKINKSYGDNHVLCDIDLIIEDKELVVIVGPSGCGKTTLLRVIAGLEKIDSGTLEIDGMVVNDMPPASRNVAMVFQTYALYPHLTVTDNLAFGLRQAKIPANEIEKRITETCEKLSLTEYRDRKPSELSGGQRQRVALGRALVRQPKLFLFDEPLSNLDAALRMNTRIEIADLHRTLGTNIIYVTHDQTEAMTLADKIVVMRDGRIEQVGSPMELYNSPINRFVAGFLGSPAMNFIEADTLSFAGAKVVGLRPQHFYISENGRLKGNVIHFERLGSDTHVIVRLDRDVALVVRLVGQKEFDLNEPIELDFDDKDALLFDASGLRLRATETASV